MGGGLGPVIPESGFSGNFERGVSDARESLDGRNYSRPVAFVRAVHSDSYYVSRPSAVVSVTDDREINITNDENCTAPRDDESFHSCQSDEDVHGWGFEAG